MADPTGPAGPPLSVTVTRPAPAVWLVRPAGDLDVATTPLLARSLREHTAGRPRHLVLDLSAVRLLSAVGVGLIVGAQQNRAGVHGRLHLTGVAGNRPVERVLGLTGVRQFLDVHDDVEELLGRLRRD